MFEPSQPLFLWRINMDPVLDIMPMSPPDSLGADGDDGGGGNGLLALAEVCQAASASTAPNAASATAATTTAATATASASCAVAGVSTKVATIYSTYDIVKNIVIVCLRICTCTATSFSWSGDARNTMLRWMRTINSEKPEVFSAQDPSFKIKRLVILLQLFLLSNMLERARGIFVSRVFSDKEEKEAVFSMIGGDSVKRILALPGNNDALESDDAVFSATFWMLLLQVLTNETTIG